MKMDASHVLLEVVAPLSFCEKLVVLIKKYNKSHGAFINNGFVDSKISGLSMSLNVLAFRDGFDLPFNNGADVKSKCFTHQLTPEGREIRDAFNNLTPVWP